MLPPVFRGKLSLRNRFLLQKEEGGLQACVYAFLPNPIPNPFRFGLVLLPASPKPQPSGGGTGRKGVKNNSKTFANEVETFH